jgi:8-oxo-dGTP pyrophosphatase MutT (NUDIX family)
MIALIIFHRSYNKLSKLIYMSFKKCSKNLHDNNSHPQPKSYSTQSCVPSKSTIQFKKTYSNNAAIICITDTNRVLLVHDTRKQKWMIPGGERNGIEPDFDCALREFKEETSFSLDPKLFSSINSYIRLHHDGSKTMIYIIYTCQRFRKYDKSKVHKNETDDLHYLRLDDFKKIINGTLKHDTVKIFVDYVEKSFRDLIKYGHL